MALLSAAGTEDELDYSNQTADDEEYVCLPSPGSTELEEEEEEEYICLASYGCTEHEEEKEEEEGLDEEQQVLCEGSLSQQGHLLLCVLALASSLNHCSVLINLCRSYVESEGDYWVFV